MWDNLWKITFKKFADNKRSLRFQFGELAWSALTWYFSKLRWPRNDPKSMGITWIELCLGFELATGLTLPRSARTCETHFGSRRLGRLASWTHQQNNPPHSSKLEHVLEKVLQKKKLRFRCIVCSRSGNWGERSRFMKNSCAGYTETPDQAMRRMKLERDAARCASDKPLPPATLHEKYIVFADMVSSCARHQPCFYGDKTLTCRALAPLEFPKSSGLTRKPILMCQEHVTAELQLCAEALPRKLLEVDSLPNIKRPAWATHCVPFSTFLPRTLWRPPPAPDYRSPLLVDKESFGKLVSTLQREPLRTNLMSQAASGCTHLAGFMILDKPSSICLLLELRKSRKPYAAGTLKAILANAIKTAVLFHKAKLTDSPICPFCDNNCYEDTLHMFEMYPRWVQFADSFFHLYNLTIYQLVPA